MPRQKLGRIHTEHLGKEGEREPLTMALICKDWSLYREVLIVGCLNFGCCFSCTMIGMRTLCSSEDADTVGKTHLLGPDVETVFPGSVLLAPENKGSWVRNLLQRQSVTTHSR